MIVVSNRDRYTVLMSKKRSYKQFCPMSYSLDAIGDRWVIMIIRELLFGPRRFTDIKRGLPNLATNLLAQRLKDLEADGFIQQREIPPPVATHVYELTPYGKSVETVIHALYFWGLHRMVEGDFQSDNVSFVCSIYSMTQLFKTDVKIRKSIRVQVHADGEILHACLESGKIEGGIGAIPDPDLVFETTPKMFLKLMAIPNCDVQLLADGSVTLHKGDEKLFARFASYFAIPETPVPVR